MEYDSRLGWTPFIQQANELLRENKLLKEDNKELQERIKELQDQIAIIMERTLRAVDAVNALAVLFFVQMSEHGFLNDLFHPVGIEEGEFTSFGDFQKILWFARLGRIVDVFC